MNLKIASIPCDLSQGMFDNEYAVELTVSGGKVVSFFADKCLVKTNGTTAHGLIKVGVAGEVAGQSKILLPSEAFESGSRWVEVPRGQLQPT
jgi:hypothetical protein